MLKLVILPLLLSPPSIRQQENDGEEVLEPRHSLLPADLSAILDCKLSPILELPKVLIKAASYSSHHTV